MNKSPAPDVDRVLDRMGRSAFGYHSFANPVDDAAAAASVIDAAKPQEAVPAALFSLIGAALPAAPKADSAPGAVAAGPLPPQMQAPANPPDIRPAGQRTRSLADMFRILSGNAGMAPAWRDTSRQEAGFPFRRR
jgi:hypothetical protein